MAGAPTVLELIESRARHTTLERELARLLAEIPLVVAALQPEVILLILVLALIRLLLKGSGGDLSREVQPTFSILLPRLLALGWRDVVREFLI